MIESNNPSSLAFNFADDWASFTCIHECALALDRLLQDTRLEVLDFICSNLEPSDREKIRSLFDQKFN